MKFNTFQDMLETLDRMTPEYTDGVKVRLQVELDNRLKNKESKEEVLVALEEFADAIKDDVYRYREFTHPDNKLQSRFDKSPVDEVTCIELFEFPAFYEDCRIDPVYPDKCTLKRLEARHSDDGENYYCELADSIWANHSGTFYITARDYETLRTSKMNKSETEGMVRIYLDDEDQSVNHAMDQRIKIK